MKTVLIGLLVAGSLLASNAIAHASGSLTSTVVDYDPVKMTILTGAFENISIRFEGLEIPPTLSKGDKIRIDFDAGEDGFDRITAVTIIEDN